MTGSMSNRTYHGPVGVSEAVSASLRVCPVQKRKVQLWYGHLLLERYSVSKLGLASRETVKASRGLSFCHP
jgi:hypothetical protein